MHCRLKRNREFCSIAAANAGAFGAAAMISVATAPSARADDFSDIISAIDGDFTARQRRFFVRVVRF